MANLNEVLEALSTKEQAIKPEDLAKELRASVEGTRKQLNRLKEKEDVEGDSKEGWYITDTGRKFLETAKKLPLTKEDVGEDELSRFQWYGQLSGVKADKIAACADLFQNTDMRSMTEVERVFAEMNVPGTQRSQWKNLYRGYLRNTTAPEKREELYPLPSPEEVRAAAEKVAGEGGERFDFIVEDNNVIRVGDELGMFTFKQALMAVAAKRGTTPQVAQAGQQSSADEIIKIVNAVREWGGQSGQAAPKSYIVTPGEEGAIVQEAEPGKPVVLSAPQASKPTATWFVDGEGNVKQAQPGEPIIIKQQPTLSPPQKTFIVRQTSEGVVAEEHDIGSPIIISNPAPSANMPPMVPYPVMDGDGKPVLGPDGQPVYANLEPMMKWMGFQGEQRRADERHSAAMSLVQTVKEILPDGIQAIREAAAEAKGKAPQQQKPSYECGECHTKFTLEREPVEGENVKCPQCGTEWPKEVVTGP